MKLMNDARTEPDSCPVPGSGSSPLVAHAHGAADGMAFYVRVRSRTHEKEKGIIFMCPNRAN